MFDRLHINRKRGRAESYRNRFCLQAGCASLFPMFVTGFQQCGEKQCGKIPRYQSNSAPDLRFLALH
jgi:hypothetical protein